jgi:hypothetical protein
MAGRSRLTRLRSGGSALANAWRTIRRCTPSFCATARIVPTPNSYSRRICSNSSTLVIRSIPSLRLFSRMLDLAGWGQFSRSKGAVLHYRNQVFSSATIRASISSMAFCVCRSGMNTRRFFKVCLFSLGVMVPELLRSLISLPNSEFKKRATKWAFDRDESMVTCA